MNKLPHISVCICTYKRQEFLARLLAELHEQETSRLFTYSIVVVDNDHLRSAQPVVETFCETHPTISIRYEVEPQQNIALARNRAVANSSGDFIAFIDDDEFPIHSWLVTLFRAATKYGVDGVLGPVKPHFDKEAPEWVIKGKFYERETYPTGLVIDWQKGRTGNVLLRNGVFAEHNLRFRPEFRSGEDQDFFNRAIKKGYVFVWCNEAVAYEVVPPVRWKRTYMLRRALLRGFISRKTPKFGILNLAKSVVAVPVYMVALPFGLVTGHDKFMNLLVRLCDHLGKLLGVMGFNPVKEPYVTE
jgi:glycosyltransferase involved in cell wall biosynthesis